MSRYMIRAVATWRRLAWLRECRDHAPADRAGWHHTPFHCARLGWTQWVFLANEIVGEKLTDEGRAVLDAIEKGLPMDDPKEKLSCGVCGKQPVVAVVVGTGAALCKNCMAAFLAGQQSPARQLKLLTR